MKKRVLATRLAAVAMAVMIMTTALAGCNSNTEPEKVKLTNVFKQESIKMSEEIQNVERLLVTDTNVYCSGSWSDATTGEWNSGLYSMKLDGTDAKLLFKFENTSDPEKSIYSSTYLQNMAVDSTGALWCIVNESYNDYSDPNKEIYENRMWIRKYDAAGEITYEINAGELVEDEYVYIDRLVFDKQNNLFFSTGNKLFMIDSAGNVMFNIEEPNYINGLFNTADGAVCITTYNEKGQVIKPVDVAKKAWGQEAPLTANNIYNMMPGNNGYDFYYQDNVALYGYKIATNESVEVLNWINSDINSNRIGSLVPLADGRVVGIEYPEDYNRSKPSLIILTKRPDDEIVEKRIITYACMWMGDDIRSAIIKFNKNSDEYRIQVSDYSKFSTNENYMAGYDQLNLDIISGRIPDIICTDSLQVSVYINKGLLADMNKFLENDTEVTRDKLLPNVLDAFSQDGKLYQIATTFNIWSVAGKEKNVGSGTGWTIDDLKALLASKPEGTVAFADETKMNILYYSLYMTMGQFVNWETGQCTFSDGSFAKMLEFANTFVEEINWEEIYGGDNWQEYEQLRQSMYKEDRTLLLTTYVGSLRDIRNYTEQFGDKINFIGFPTANKKGSVIMPQNTMAISSKSKNQDGAWEFVKSFLKDDYSSPYMWGFPVNKAKLEEMCRIEMLPLKDRPDQNGGIIYKTAGAANVAVATTDVIGVPASPGDMVEETDWEKEYPLKQEEIDQMMKLITSVDTLNSSDQKIVEIINEEVEPYFKGVKKDAAAVAEMVQGRVQTYVSESR